MNESIQVKSKVKYIFKEKKIRKESFNKLESLSILYKLYFMIEANRLQEINDSAASNGVKQFIY